MTKFLAFMALLVAAWIFAAWMLMLTVGVVHLHWIPQLPTLSFKVALLLATLVFTRAFVLAIFTTASKEIAGSEKRR